MYVCTLEEPCVTTPGNLFTAFALGRNAGEKTEEPHVKRYVSANGGLATSTKVRTSGVPITSAARGDDFKCRPFRKKIFSVGKNVNQNAKISDDLFF